jgi:hypothetical protein
MFGRNNEFVIFTWYGNLRIYLKNDFSDDLGKLGSAGSTNPPGVTFMWNFVAAPFQKIVRGNTIPLTPKTPMFSDCRQIIHPIIRPRIIDIDALK